jgi:hypothetical protein
MQYISKASLWVCEKLATLTTQPTNGDKAYTNMGGEHHAQQAMTETLVRKAQSSREDEKAMVVKLALWRKRIPRDVVHLILDAAGFFFKVHTTGEVELEGVSWANETIVKTTIRAHQRHRLVGVQMQCESHDQGWAGDQTSWTWLELEFTTAAPEGKEQIKLVRELVRNRSACSAWQAHDILKRTDDGLLDDAFPLGQDVEVSVLARSLYPGWQIFTSPATITLVFKNSCAW